MIRSLQSFWIATFLIFFQSTLFAQYNSSQNQTATNQPTVKGQIMDAGTKEPLEYATVGIMNPQDSSMITGGITDEKGRFALAVAPGNYWVKVSFVSYQTQIIKDVQVQAGSGASLGKIMISENSQVLDAIEITGKRSQMELDLDKRVFNVDQDLSNIGNNASEILQNLPSVNVDTEGNVSLRGSQNVRILVNGKPSGLVGIGDGTSALRMLQGDLIEKVEVITNPSARYDAEGEVGIINIVLKKEERRGVNGSFDVNTGYPDNHGVAFNLNYRRNWLNLFGSYGFNYRNYTGGGNSYQENFEIEEPDFETVRDHERGGWSNNLRFGADFYLSDRDIITTSGLYRFSDGDNVTSIRYNDFDDAGNLLGSTRRIQNEAEPEHNIEWNVSYRKTFDQKDRLWTVDLRWMQNDETETADIRQEDLNSQDAPIFQKTSNTEDEINWLFQTDYVHPFDEGKGKFETGIRTTLRTINNDYFVKEQTGEEFVTLPGFNDEFTYDENIYAAYVMGGYELGRFSFQLGLRMEYTDIRAESVADQTVAEQNYHNFFPTAHTNYQINKGNSIQLSYSRRLSRPRFRSLLPFSNFSDARNFREGNPNLQPEFTHSIEAGYLKEWKTGSLLSSVYYRHRTGVIERITFRENIVDEEGNEELINITRPINLAKEDAVGVEFSLSLDLTPWWTINTNANFYRAVTSGTFVNTEVENDTINLERDTYTWNNRTTSRVNLPWGIDWQTSLNYRAPQQSPQGRDLAVYSIDLGFSKDILKGKGTIALNVQDLFNSRKWRSETNGADFFRTSEFQWRTRQVRLTFNYRLNQNKSRGKGGRGDYDGGDGF